MVESWEVRDPLMQLADDVRELTQHYRHEEKRPHTWTRSRNKRQPKPHVTWHAPLLVQLHQTAFPNPSGTFVGAGRSGARSSAPARLDALTQLHAIRRDVAAWRARLALRTRGSVTADIGALVGAAASRPGETLTRLAGDVNRWRLSCLTLTGWRSSYKPPAPCPQCGQMPGQLDGRPVGLRVRLDKSTACCMTDDCGAVWNPSTIGVLAEHVKAYRQEQTS